MTTINLRDYYPWYRYDVFVEVTEEVAETLFMGRRYNRTHQRRMRHNKTYFFDDNTETQAAVILYSIDDPDTVLAMKERHCRLCYALNSLPEIQGRRVEAHFLFGMSSKEIAKAEGVSKSAVNQSIVCGLRAMKNFLRNFESSLVECLSRPL